MVNDLTLIVTGGRDWADGEAVWNALCDRVPVAADGPITVTVRHGACPTGADLHAHDWCEDNAAFYERQGIEIVEDPHPADWKRWGKPAGMRRNGEMVKLGADEVLAFPDVDSIGTYGCVDLAVRASIPVTILRLPNDPPKRVQRKRIAGWKKPPAAVVVTRPGPFGNPFAIGDHPLIPDAATAVAAFEDLLTWRRTARNPRAYPAYPSDNEIRRCLAGRDLACYCAPGQPCHADVLLALANGASND